MRVPSVLADVWLVWALPRIMRDRTHRRKAASAAAEGATWRLQLRGGGRSGRSMRPASAVCRPGFGRLPAVAPATAKELEGNARISPPQSAAQAEGLMGALLPSISSDRRHGHVRRLIGHLVCHLTRHLTRHGTRRRAVGYGQGGRRRHAGRRRADARWHEHEGQRDQNRDQGTQENHEDLSDSCILICRIILRQVTARCTRHCVTLGDSHAKDTFAKFSVWRIRAWRLRRARCWTLLSISEHELEFAMLRLAVGVCADDRPMPAVP